MAPKMPRITAVVLSLNADPLGNIEHVVYQHWFDASLACVRYLPFRPEERPNPSIEVRG